MRENELPVLETVALEKRFGGVKAVAGVNFALYSNEIRCLIGPNGAGKSTFFKLVTGQLRPSGGEITIFGTQVQRAHSHEIAGLRVGIKNQVPDVMNGLSVRENLFLAAASRYDAKRSAREVDKVAERISLTGIMDRLVGELAHGQRQWVEMAMVVVPAPLIVLLDEPAAGMSDEEANKTAEMIKELNKEATIVVVEHDMEFIKQIAATVTVFHEGRILIEDTFENVVANETVRNVYLGRGGVG